MTELLDDIICRRSSKNCSGSLPLDPRSIRGLDPHQIDQLAGNLLVYSVVECE